jgi:hypothetical protein
MPRIKELSDEKLVDHFISCLTAYYESNKDDLVFIKGADKYRDNLLSRLKLGQEAKEKLEKIREIVSRPLLNCELSLNVAIKQIRELLSEK